MPQENPVANNRHITPRQRLRLLPRDIIYVLGVVVFVALAALLSFLISNFF